MGLLSNLWDRLFGADKAADSASDQPPGQSACPPKIEPYIVRVTVKTRDGDIPVKDIEVKLDDASLGKSSQEGKLPDSPPRTKPTFKLTAVYVNDSEKLKREDYALKVAGIVVPGGSFSADAANEIKKIRDVAGNRDDKNFLDLYTPSADEVNYEDSGGKHIFNVVIHLATLSLQVPYLNQNSQNDTLSTSASHDPEGSSHTHDVVGDTSDGKFGGGVLCFSSSTTMLLWYWGKTALKRRDVLQKCYDVWAAAGFPHRLGHSATKSADAPADPAVGSYWLETKDPPNAKYGYALKRCVQTKAWDPDDGQEDADYEQPTPPASAAVGKTWLDTSKDPPQRKKLATHKEWQQVPDRDWRVVIADDQGAYKIWVKWDYHKKAIDALRPSGTTLNDVVDGTAIESLSDNIRPDGGGGTYAAAIADKLAAGYPSVYGTNATGFGHIMIVRGCVMDHDGQVVRLIINDPYGTLESPKSMLHQYKISDSVGKDGTNNPDDVAEVQTVLNVLGYWDDEVDGHCDGTGEDELVQAIQKYQGALGARRPDGLIKVGGRTDNKLKTVKGVGGYSSIEQEPNGKGTDPPAATRGKHVYYDGETKVPSGGLRLKGAWRGAVMLEKDSPFTLSELTGKLTPNSP